MFKIWQGGEEGGMEAQDGGDTYIPMADSYWRVAETITIS